MERHKFQQIIFLMVGQGWHGWRRTQPFMATALANPNYIPFGSRLLEDGADPKTKLPIGAMIRFHLEPVTNSFSSDSSASQ